MYFVGTYLGIRQIYECVLELDTAMSTACESVWLVKAKCREMLKSKEEICCPVSCWMCPSDEEAYQ